MKFPIASQLLLITATLVLSGCGGAEEAESKHAYRGIFVSTNDCQYDKNLTLEICETAINSAIDAHNKNSPSYATLRACVGTEDGAGCERDVNQKFRPRLVAYIVEASEPPTGIPLYGKPKTKGFRDSANVMYLDTDLTVTFSKQATAAFAK